jgi:outer membrane protein assembly factor BamE (lipoprotein component of BamABCDE complex)
MTKQKWFLIGLLTLALALASGCVYRANIAQGNVVKEEDLAQVEIGMRRWVTVFFEDDLVSEILPDQELNPDL